MNNHYVTLQNCVTMETNHLERKMRTYNEWTDRHILLTFTSCHVLVSVKKIKQCKQTEKKNPKIYRLYAFFLLGQDIFTLQSSFT